MEDEDDQRNGMSAELHGFLILEDMLAAIETLGVYALSNCPNTKVRMDFEKQMHRIKEAIEKRKSG